MSKFGKTLIAIAGCHKYRARADAQRQTWVGDVGAADVKFFAGLPHVGSPAADEVWLNCGDSYVERKEKVIAIIRWAIQQDYDYLWKVDDDVYLRPERLLALDPRDFYGAVAAPASVCIGAIYGLSRSSMEKLLLPDTQVHQLYEDIWVSNRLAEHGVLPTNLGWDAGRGGWFRMTRQKGVPFGINIEPPRPDNDVIASWEYVTPEEMQQVHQPFDPS